GLDSLILQRQEIEDKLPSEDENNIHDDEKQTHTNNSHKEDFDLFVLNNFDPFDGKQNVIDWIDITEEKFKEYKFNRHYRYEAVPLLVSNDAKRWYIRQ
ncbi:unnamed protein product, partial [Didymodactylos carnosus]